MHKIDSFIDKSKWCHGPWTTEPDRVEWIDTTTGYLCLAQRNEETGTWCGYVGVPPAHPAYGKDPDSLHAEDDIQVHGGISYAGDYPAQHLWLLGFCCNHPADLLPALTAIHHAFPPVPGLTPQQAYRDLEYVKDECVSLAQQLKNIL